MKREKKCMFCGATNELCESEGYWACLDCIADLEPIEGEELEVMERG
jgi:ribosomal protein L37AE/L43A